MRITFDKLSPGGNDTIIVRSAVPENKRVAFARTLMSNAYAGGEQVGYLVPSRDPNADARLEMMGGELCINALRCAATLIAQERKETMVRIASSGTDQIFVCIMKKMKRCTETMIKFTAKPRLQTLDSRSSIVYFPGIVHVLYALPQNERGTNPSVLFEKLYAKFKDQLSAFPACGVIPYWGGPVRYRIKPVVFVAATHSVIRETGCGSGSIALAYALSPNRKKAHFRVLQPSGTPYLITMMRQASGWNVSLRSKVRRCISGTAYL